MKSNLSWISMIGGSLVVSVCLAQSAEPPASCPEHEKHMRQAADPSQTPPSEPPGHAAGVVERGDHVMGFDHSKTTHHFRLTETGGAIEAEASDPADAASRDQIRMHFAHIAKMFSEGNFDAPMLIHDRVPPGVPAMKKHKGAIRYDVQPTERGGRVVITTKDARALAAIHEFLRFQIQDHQTGDSPEVGKESPGATS